MFRNSIIHKFSLNSCSHSRVCLSRDTSLTQMLDVLPTQVFPIVVFVFSLVGEVDELEEDVG